MTIAQRKPWPSSPATELSGPASHYAQRVDTFRDFGGESRNLTSAEDAFLKRLLVHRPPYLDVWLHTDADGHPWMLISLDFTEARAVRDTLRLDFDGTSIAGGWSPYFLNGDEGVRAEAASIALAPPDGIQLSDRAPAELVDAARRWFDEHWKNWPSSARRARWKL